MVAALLLGALTPGGLLAVAVGVLALAFLFSLLESSLSHHSGVRLMEEARRRGVEERIRAALAREEQTYLAAKMGRGLFQLPGVALLAVALVRLEPAAPQAALWAILAGVLFLLLNVAAPYIVGRRAGHRILLRWLIPFRAAAAPLVPAALLMQRCAGWLFGSAGGPDRSEEITDDILSAVEEGGREGLLGEDEQQMIEGVIDLRDVTADHVMTPRTAMVSVGVDASLPEVVDAAVRSGHSRLPVYSETPDQVVGVLYVKDLLPYLRKDGEPPRVQEVLRPAFFIPESKNVRDLLRELKARQVHMAVVLDEYGGTAGVVTIEDILEEIVGEIVDEHEQGPPREIVKLTENVASVEARTHIEDLNRSLSIELPEHDDYDTVGGLLFTRMGRVPSAGEHFDLNGVRFTVLEADARRVGRVKVTVHRRPEPRRS
ncbi:MAG: hemolysin family protein [Planctomycetota bacterium]